ncbi:ABC transporter ATP-binding protein [Beduini massiliensis]|uniref:ABC transporter ATP-binding protein n=1 Tax=Beduini massiliensis TaxID=1585974 RepID=UPI00059AA4AF|nr:ABC transporter ATP-binding protein [Beduini massiliensis]
MNALIELKNVSKIYYLNKKQQVSALKNINLSIKKGDFLVVMGTSGSGKSTLLNMITTVDEPTSGDIIINGKSIHSMASEDKAIYRYKELNFIFQDFNLLNSLNIYENIEIPLMMNGIDKKTAKEKIIKTMRELGINDLIKKYPIECSGGQLQRVAIARAIVSSAPLIVADEPTGNLDSKNAAQMMELLSQLNSQGTTIILVTHDSAMASYGNELVYIKDGEIYQKLKKDNKTRQAYYQQIVEITANLNN